MKELQVSSLRSTKSMKVISDAGYFPVVLRTGPKSAIAAIRAGAGHIGIEGRLDVILTDDRGETWSEPIEAADSDWDDRNPSLGRARDGTLVLAYHHQGNYDSNGDYIRGGDRVDTYLKRSTDDGRTWSEAYPLSIEGLRGRSPYGRMINVGDELLMNIYGAKMDGTEDEMVSYVVRSADGGRTWHDPTEIAGGMNETALVNLPDDSILALLRSDKGHPPSIYGSRSTDGGYNWTDPVRITEDSEHPADAVLLSNGWILLVYGYRHEPYGVRGMVTTDQGRSWEKTPEIVFEDGLLLGDCGYPSIAVLQGGRILLMYYSAGEGGGRSHAGAYAKAVLFDEEDLISALEENWASR